MSRKGKETVLHTFIYGASDGAEPIAGLVRDEAGTLYGSTPNGGSFCYRDGGCGIVFKVDISLLLRARGMAVPDVPYHLVWYQARQPLGNRWRNAQWRI